MSDRPKFPRIAAIEVAKEMCDLLKPVTNRLIVAGSLRRRKQEVGDVEILFVPKFETRQVDFFASANVSLADELLGGLIRKEVIRYRPTVTGAEPWGPKNKHAVHCASGIPVDFFTATESNWFNYLVCRTGGAENNKHIAMMANRKNWTWKPYGVGFEDERGVMVPVTGERDVFEFVGLKYLEPWERQ